MQGAMIKQCQCHVINVLNCVILLYDINDWVYLRYIFRNPAPHRKYWISQHAIELCIN